MKKHPIITNSDRLEEDRKALIAMGIPLCEDGVGYETVKAIDDMMCKTSIMRYTADDKLPFNERLKILKPKDEVWRSFHEDFIAGNFPIRGDCDEFANTSIHLAYIMGVPLNRLAFGIVVSETAWRMQKKPVNISNVDHAIGMYWTGETWLTFGDTWGQTKSPSMVPANERHKVVMMAIVDEGWTWRNYSE